MYFVSAAVAVRLSDGVVARQQFRPATAIAVRASGRGQSVRQIPVVLQPNDGDRPVFGQAVPAAVHRGLLHGRLLRSTEIGLAQDRALLVLVRRSGRDDGPDARRPAARPRPTRRRRPAVQGHARSNRSGDGRDLRCAVFAKDSLRNRSQGGEQPDRGSL